MFFGRARIDKPTSFSGQSKAAFCSGMDEDMPSFTRVNDGLSHTGLSLEHLEGNRYKCQDTEGALRARLVDYCADCDWSEFHV
jgi:hypothetical protein